MLKAYPKLVTKLPYAMQNGVTCRWAPVLIRALILPIIHNENIQKRNWASFLQYSIATFLRKGDLVT